MDFKFTNAHIQSEILSFVLIHAIALFSTDFFCLKSHCLIECEVNWSCNLVAQQVVIKLELTI